MSFDIQRGKGDMSSDINLICKYVVFFINRMEMGMLMKDGFGGEYRGYNMEKAIMSFDIQRGRGSYVF